MMLLRGCVLVKIWCVSCCMLNCVAVCDCVLILECVLLLLSVVCCVLCVVVDCWV